MFFLITLHKIVQLQPRYFGPKLRTTLIEKLYSEVEGSCSGRYGFIIAVTSVDEIGLGKIQEGTGLVQFPITYQAIVFRPFRNEVVDAVVKSVNKYGFLAEVGPLQVFVSKHCMHNDFKFDANGTNGACFVSEDESVKVSKGDEVRLKITGTRVDTNELFCIGTIKDDYLGPIS